MAEGVSGVPAAGDVSPRYSLDGWHFTDPLSLYRVYGTHVLLAMWYCVGCGCQVGNHGVQFAGLLATHCNDCARVTAAQLVEADPHSWGSPEAAEATLRSRLPEWLETQDRRWRERSTICG